MFAGRDSRPGLPLPPTIEGRAAAPYCGNGVLDPGELCDGSDLNGSTCAGFGYSGAGFLACSGLCVFDVSQCRLGQAPAPSFDAGQDDQDEDGGIDLAF